MATAKRHVHLKLVGGTEAHIAHQAMMATKNHFQFDVGTGAKKATVHVHQAFRPGEKPFIRIEYDGDERTLEIEGEDPFQGIEIKIQTMD